MPSFLGPAASPAPSRPSPPPPPLCSKVLAVCLIALACIANVVLVARTCAGVLRLKVFIPEHVSDLCPGGLPLGSCLLMALPLAADCWLAGEL